MPGEYIQAEDWFSVDRFKLGQVASTHVLRRASIGAYVHLNQVATGNQFQKPVDAMSHLIYYLLQHWKGGDSIYMSSNHSEVAAA
jgi:hypothetical protein